MAIKVVSTRPDSLDRCLESAPGFAEAGHLGASWANTFVLFCHCSVLLLVAGYCFAKAVSSVLTRLLCGNPDVATH